jgi:hypothetical protein
MSRRPAAANAVGRTVTDYGPDPHGAGLVGALNAAIAGTLNGARAVVVRNPTWHGWTRTLQSMHGAAHLGTARVFAPKNSELSRETTTTDPTAAAIFASRMQRGR